jgi:hypothetical protein
LKAVLLIAAGMLAASCASDGGASWRGDIEVMQYCKDGGVDVIFSWQDWPRWEEGWIDLAESKEDFGKDNFESVRAGDPREPSEEYLQLFEDEDRQIEEMFLWGSASTELHVGDVRFFRLRLRFADQWRSSRQEWEASRIHKLEAADCAEHQTFED